MLHKEGSVGVIIYNKLVRDKIPQIIKQRGNSCELKELNTEEYLTMLNVKLQEELDEYIEAKGNEQIAELADLVEVVYAILTSKGVSIEDFEKIRLSKKDERGGFENRLMLVSVDDNN